MSVSADSAAGGRGAVALSWSGGKDSALALWALREELGIEPAALLTTFTAEHDRVSMHGVRRELVRAQAAAAGLPLVEVEIPAGCGNELYERRMAAAWETPALAGVRLSHVWTGRCSASFSQYPQIGSLEGEPIFRESTRFARQFQL